METNQATAPESRGRSQDLLRDHRSGEAAHLAAEPELAAAWNHELTERRAQAAKIEALLAYKARKLEQNKSEHAFTRRAVEKAVTREAATILGLTETAVRRLMTTAEFLSEKLPQTWEAYRAGRIDRESAAKAAVAVEDIAHRKDLLAVIDAEVTERAPKENAAAVGKWAQRRVAELDEEGFQERYDKAQRKRYVKFRHLGNGMSHIEALIPTLVAAQVEQQIHSEARNAPRIAPGGSTTSSTASAGGEQGVDQGACHGTKQDASHRTGQSAGSQERTLSQRITDAFITRLNTGGDKQTGGAGINGQGLPGNSGVKIGILVPVQTLSGDSDDPALSWDRAWSLPAGTARQIALDPDAEHDWYIVGTAETVASAAAAPEILSVVHPRKGPGDQPLEDWIHGADPVSGNLLTRAYRSRTAKDRQRDAILMRDGQCTQEGCTNPGWQAEIDHTKSYETGGHTTGTNLKILCRDCHSIKSHRLGHEGDSGQGPQSGTESRSDSRFHSDSRPKPEFRSRSSSEAQPNSGSPPDSGPGAEPEPRPSAGAEFPPGPGAPARASPEEDDLPEWLIETRPPPDWAVGDAA